MDRESVPQSEQQVPRWALAVVSDIRGHNFRSMVDDAGTVLIGTIEDPDQKVMHEMGAETIKQLRLAQRLLEKEGKRGVLFIGDLFSGYMNATMRFNTFERTRFYLVCDFAHKAGFDIFFMLSDQARIFMQLIIGENELPFPYHYIRENQVADLLSGGISEDNLGNSY